MRNRIWEICWQAEFNVSFWSRVECCLHRVDVLIKILLGRGAVVSLVTLAWNGDLVNVVAWATGICAVISTIVIPAIRWPETLSDVKSFKHQWIGIARQSKVFWEDSEDGKRISKKGIEDLEKAMRDLERESFLLGDFKKKREEAIREAKNLLRCK